MEGDGNRWANVQGDPGEVSSSIEWRSQLHPDARHRIVNKIMDTLKRHIFINGAEGISELNKIAVRFEEKIYTAATSQADYLRRISMKMLTMEQKSSVAANPIALGSTIMSQDTADPASLMQSQVRNQGLSMQVPVANQPQARQQLLGRNLQNNVTSTTMQGTGSLSPELSSLTGLTQPNMTTFGQNQNMHAMPGIGQNSVNNTPGQNVPPSMYANSQRQIQGRSYQQPIMSQQHQQQPQNQPLYRQHLLKQKLQQTSQMQSQIPQQQNAVMQVNQLQSSQQPLVQMSSGHQSNQGSLQHSQSTMIQSVSQNQQNPIQQPGASLHQQSIVRQQPSQQPNLHQQASSHVQQPSSITQQSAVLPSQQQQNIGHPSNMSSVQSNKLLVQQNNISNLQQQFHQQKQHQGLTNQQNGPMSMQQQQMMINQQNNSLHQQQQMPSQNSTSSLQQQQSLQARQPQPQIESLSAVSSMQHHHPVHIMQHSRAASQQVQQTPQSPLQLQNQQIQAQSSQQQHVPQLQLQTHLQPPIGMQQMQQRLQASAALLQPQNAVELQKQQFQSQRVHPDPPSTSVDSTAQTGQACIDWQEEVYQKIKSLKEMYSADLQDMSQRIGAKLQQESLALPLKQSEQIEGMKKLKSVVERMLQLLHFPKSSIQPGFKDKLPVYEKQIIHILSTRGRRPGPSQLQGQQQLQQSGTQNLPMPQPPSQVSHQQQADSQLNQMQQVTFQANSAPMHSTAMSTMQIGSMPLPTQSGVSSTQINMLIPTQSGYNPETGNTPSSMQQGSINSLQAGGLVSLQQSSINLAHQNNVNTLMQNNLNSMQHSIDPPQANSSILQPQIKQEQQQHQAQQMAMQKRMPQQLIQQRLQQQPQLRQQLQLQKQQSNSQLPGNQMQLQQMNEMNELKVKQVSSSKSGLFQPHSSSGQRQTYYQQQQQQLHKLPTSFPVSSPQNLQVPSPQISQHSSPQIDQQTLFSSVAKSGTALQSVNSPFVVPSPSTPLAPSPLQVEQEKPPSTLSSLQNAGNVGNQQSILMSSQTQSLTVGTPGISASPLLAEFSSVEGNQTTNLSVMLPGKPTAAELPVERLLKAVRSSSPEVLASSAHDIASVVSMIDRIAGSAPGNGSRAAVCEDLVAMTKCRMQARNFMSQDGAVTKKMKRHTSAIPLNIVPFAGSFQDTLKHSSVETSELESTATSRIKQLKMEINNALLEEIKYVNQQLIDTVVDITDDDIDSISSTTEGEGTVVKFTYCAVALSPSLKSQFASAKVSPILPMRLLIPANYPHRSPVLLDKIPVESSQESEDLTVKVKSRFGISLRGLSQPMSLKEMARTWDVCARIVISEYAQASGEGSSRYGTWQNVAKA